jgi:hypothetical protein
VEKAPLDRPLDNLRVNQHQPLNRQENSKEKERLEKKKKTSQTEQRKPSPCIAPFPSSVPVGGVPCLDVVQPIGFALVDSFLLRLEAIACKSTREENP